MARCGCSGSCSCLIEAGEGVVIEGIGSVENPYVITSEATEMVDRIKFNDTSSVDFTVTGLGTVATPLNVSAVAKLKMTDLTDVSGTPSNGQVMVWEDDHWEPQNQSGSGGGGTGLPPGGVAGDLLVKQSATDGDAVWKTPETGTDYAVLRANAVQTMTTSTEVSITYAAAASSDPKGMWDGSTLITVQKDGVYRVTCWYSFAYNATGNRIALIRINGTTTRQWYCPAQVGTNPTVGTVTQDLVLKAGDTVQFRQYQSSGANLDTFATSTSYAPGLAVARIGSALGTPQDVVMGEKVYAIAARQTTGQIISNNTNGTPVLFDTVDYTEGGIAYNQATGQFTVPVAGYYQVNTKVHWPASATGRRRIRIGLDGSSGIPGIKTDLPAASGDSVVYGYSRVVKCNAGSVIIVGVDHTAGADMAIGSYTSVDITKVPAPVVPGRAASGIWGAAPLDKFGADTYQGQAIYVDANGQLRAEPLTIPDPIDAYLATDQPITTTVAGAEVPTQVRATMVNPHNTKKLLVRVLTTCRVVVSAAGASLTYTGVLRVSTNTTSVIPNTGTTYDNNTTGQRTDVSEQYLTIPPGETGIFGVSASKSSSPATVLLRYVHCSVIPVRYV